MFRILFFWLSQRGRLKPGNFLLDLGELWRVDPLLVPITPDSLARTGSDGLEHELSWVDIAWNLGTVALEIVNEDMRVFTNVTEVDGLATTLEKQETVERLEQKGVRLVNSAENLLAGSSEFTKESDQVVGGLTIETRSGLVKEKQQIGLGGQFNTNSDTLSSFDGKTVTTTISYFPPNRTHGKPIIASARSCNSSSSMMSSQ